MKLKHWVLHTLAAATLGAGMMPTATLAQSAAKDGDLFTIRIGQQPQRWALEWFIASEKGWWKELGLKPVFSNFASGAVTIAAGASGSMDVGGGGNIPAVLGASKYGLQTIGLADGESTIITMMATKEKAQEYLKNPAALKGKTFPVTTNTTSQWGAAACLQKKFGLKPGDYKLLNLAPPDINAAVTSGKYDMASVWAPNTYILEETIGAQVVCTATEMGLPIHGYMFATPEFASKHPMEVAKFMAVYLRAVAWERKHPEEAQAYLKQFFDKVGVKFDDKYLRQELRDRPVFDLDQQLKTFTPGADGKSEILNWWNEVGDFMMSVKMIKSIPDPQKNITNKYLKMIHDDPKLRTFVEEGSK